MIAPPDSLIGRPNREGGGATRQRSDTRTLAASDHHIKYGRR